MPFKLEYFSDSGGIPTLNPKWAFGLKPNVYSNSTTEPYKQKTPPNHPSRTLEVKNISCKL